MRHKLKNLVFGVFLVISSVSATAHVFQPISHNSKKCHPIAIKVCADIPYNLTMMPNWLGHTTQEDAAVSISQYNPLIKVKCSEDIKLFLCTLHAPLCTPVLEDIIKPCRHLCESAKAGCESLMVKFGFRWPENMDCALFPDTFCVGENKTTTGSGSHSSATHMECPLKMRASPEYRFALQMKSGRLEDCSLPCEADNVVPVFFTSRQRNLLRIWILVWAVACFTCSIFTILTFLIDLRRFAYPVRPIMYLALCYVGISACYIVGVSDEARTVCTSPSGHSLVSQGIAHLPCTMVAIIYYFFTMASCAWWLVLCLSWFLAARLQWGQESIASLWQCFHSVAWGGPALFSLLLLISESVDGDVFSGICSVGNLNGDALLYLVVLPQGGSILLGFCLIISGVCSMLGIRSYYKMRQPLFENDISKLEKLMMRVTLFALLYALPTALTTGILVHSWSCLPSWLESLYWQRCSRNVSEKRYCPPPPKMGAAMGEQPDLFIFAAKYASQLLVGVACAVWVLSLKTIASYRTVYSRLLQKPATQQ